MKLIPKLKIEDFSLEHLIHKDSYLVQKFIDTGDFPTHIRILIFLGEIMYSFKSQSTIQTPKTNTMSTQMSMKKIGCSNCGAELIFDPGTQMTNCNFCGSKFEIEKAVDDEIIVPDGILPFIFYYGRPTRVF